jgi:polysaccharide biosynthesis transport protein
VNVTVNNPEFAPEAAEGKTLLLSDFIRVSRRFIWLLAGLSAGCAILAFIWAKGQPREYDATAMVQVDQHGAMSLGSSMGASDEYELKIATQIFALQSRDVALKVLRDPVLDLIHNPLFNSFGKTDIDTSPETRNHLVAKFLGDLDVERVPKTELISVTFRSRSPVLSMAVTNQIVSSYMEVNFNHRYQGSKEIKNWLNVELDELKSRVQTEQSDLLNLELKLGVFSQGISGETSLYQTQLESLLAEAVKTQSTRFMSEAEYEQLAADTGGSFAPTSTPGALVLSNLNVQLASLEAQKAAMTDRYGPGYLPLKQLSEQIEGLNRAIAEQRTKILESAREDVNTNRKAESDILNSIEAVKSQARGQNPEVVHLEVLKSQYLADQTLYNSLLSLLSSGGISAGLKTQEVNRMSTADVPTVQSRPRVGLSTAAGAGIGLLLSCIIIGLIVAVSDTVETVEQIEEALGLPVLAAVPVYKLDSSDSPALITPLATISAPRSAGAEAYRILRTSVNLMPVGKDSRVIAFTSCGPGEGKSTTALNLAVSLAQQGKRILVIDADLRKPALAERIRLPQPSAPGLSRFLSDPSLRPEECVQGIPAIAGLTIMPVQEIPPFPSELLGKGRLDELTAWARQNFDVVLIDTPPALLVTDALIVAQSADIILLVARVGTAQRRSLRRLREELKKFSDKQIAVVVNAVPQSQSYYGGYGDKHGYYGSTSDGKKKKESPSK